MGHKMIKIGVRLELALHHTVRYNGHEMSIATRELPCIALHTRNEINDLGFTIHEHAL